MWLSKLVRTSRRSRRRGFSLVELMAVMIILGLLATATVIATGTYMDSARQTRVTSDMATFIKGLDSFFAVNGRYPTTAEGLNILTMPSKNSSSGFVKKISKDPWKNEYRYVSPGAKAPFEIICLGADGKEGGTGTNKDISSINFEDE